MNKKDLYKKTLQDLDTWWQSYITSKDPGLTLSNLSDADLPAKLKSDLQNIGIRDLNSVKGLILKPYNRTTGVDVLKHVQETVDATKYSPLPVTNLSQIGASVGKAELDQKTLQTVKTSIDQRIRDVEEVLSQTPKDTPEYETASSIHSQLKLQSDDTSKVLSVVTNPNYVEKLRREAVGLLQKEGITITDSADPNTVISIGKKAKDVNTLNAIQNLQRKPYSIDIEVKDLEKLRTDAIAELKKEGISINEFADPKTILSVGKSAKNINAINAVRRFLNTYNTETITSANRVLKLTGRSYGVSVPAGIQKLGIIEDANTKNKATIAGAQADAKRRILENEKVKDSTSPEFQSQIKSEIAKNKFTIYTPDEIDLALKDPINIDLFKKLLVKFNGYASKNRFDLIKNEIKSATNPFELALAQTARRAVINDKWNEKRKIINKTDSIERPPSLFIERSAINADRDAIVLPEASAVLKENDLLTQGGYIDLAKIEALTTDKKDEVRGKLIKKFEAYEIKSRMVGKLASYEKRQSPFGLYLSTKNVPDPLHKGRNVNLGNLISRYVVEEIGDQIGQSYADLKQLYGGDVVEIRKHLNDYWQKRGQAAQSARTFNAMCQKAVEKALTGVELPSGKGITPDLRNQFIDTTSTHFEELVIDMLINSPEEITPRSEFDVQFATQQEYQSSSTALKLIERSVGKASDYGLGPVPTAIASNNLVVQEVVHDFIEIPNPEALETDILQASQSQEEKAEFADLYEKNANESTKEAYSYSRSTEEFSKDFGETAQFIIDGVFNHKKAEEKIKKDREDFAKESLARLTGAVFGKEKGEELQKLFMIKDLTGIYAAILKNPKMIWQILWDKGLIGTQILDGGAKKLVSHKIARVLGLRRKIDVGNGHIIEVNIISNGIVGKFNSIMERLIGTKTGKLLGWDKTLSYENRRKKRSLAETVFVVAVTSAFNFIKGIIAKSLFGIAIKGAFERAVLGLSATPFGNGLVNTFETLKVLRHFGKAGFASLQSGLIGGVIGGLIGGPVGGVLGAVSFGGSAFVNALYKNEVFIRDYKAALTKFPNSTGLMNKFFSAIGNAAEGRGFAAAAIKGTSFWESVSKGLSGTNRLATGFRYFKGGTIAGLIAIAFGANPILAIGIGAASILGQVAIERGAAYVSAQVLAKAGPLVSTISNSGLANVLKVIGKFPVFDALGIYFAVNYAVEQIRLFSQLAKGEINIDQFNAQFFTLANLGLGAANIVGYALTLTGIVRFVGTTLIPKLFSAAALQSLGFGSAAALNPVVLASTIAGTVIGTIIGIAFGLSAGGIALAATLGAIGGLAGGLLGTLVFPSLGTVAGIAIGSTLGSLLGVAIDKVAGSLSSAIGALGAILGAFKLFKAKSIIDFAQSVVMLGLSISLGGGAALGVLTLFPSVFSLGIVAPTNSLVIVNKSFDKKISDTELQYTIKILPGNIDSLTKITGLEMTDIIANKDDIERITKLSQTSSGASDFRIRGNTIEYSYNAIQAENNPDPNAVSTGAGNSFSQVIYTYIVKLKKPLLEIAASSNFCNNIDGSVTAKQLSSDENGEPILLKDSIKQSICVDKNGQQVRTSPINGQYHPEFQGLPVDPSLVAVTQCSYSANGSHKNDRAIDIAGLGGKTGAAILAWADGVVTFTKTYAGHDPNMGFGTWAVIKHDVGGKTYYTLYGHMLPTVDNFVKVGDIVKKGEQIGEMGSTGNSTGAHLHFQIQTTDPRAFGPQNQLEPCCYIACTSYKPSGSFSNESCVSLVSNFWSNSRNSCYK